jgi:prepilin-type N-terminal cleavage/methylation domain-containing protein
MNYTTAGSREPSARSAFTLIELMVVIAVLALLMGLLLPALGRARMLTRIVRAHSDLRQIGMALETYRSDHEEQLPPARFSCSSDWDFPLPIELAEGRYLPAGEIEGFDIVDYRDEFKPEVTYCYRAPGSAYINDTRLKENASFVYVPNDFPRCESSMGKYHFDPKTSPVRWIIWSVGPRPESSKTAADRGDGPLPRIYSYSGAGDTGYIWHALDSDGTIHMSP